MPDPQVTASGERFARDMHRIREAHGISMEDIHRETMISVHIIESFEQDGLFEHPTFNRVYLRSFVRSYAAAVGVDPERALAELERALEGAYGNELAVEYLDDETEAPSTEPAASVPDEEAEASAAGGPPEAAAEMATDEAVASEPEASEDAAAPAPDESQTGIWIGIGIVLVILIAWLLIGTLRGGADAEAPPTGEADPVADTARVDTAQAALADSVAEEPEPLVDIGETIDFTVIAQERLSPIRIRRDADLRRPYYLNRGQAAAFPAQEQIIIDEAVDGIRLLVNGHEYPVPLHVFDGRLVLTRDSVQAFLDTVSTEPLSLVVPVDTFPVLGN